MHKNPMLKLTLIATPGASIHNLMAGLWFPNHSGPGRRDKCLACFASHYKCSQRRVSEASLACGSASQLFQGGCVVLEDDALLCGELPPIEQFDDHRITLLGGAMHTLSAWGNKCSAAEMDDILCLLAGAGTAYRDVCSGLAVWRITCLWQLQTRFLSTWPRCKNMRSMSCGRQIS